MASGFKFTDNSKKVKGQMDDAMFRALESAALIVEASAKALAPVGDSGELRDKIDHNVKDGANGPEAKIGSPLDYAMYVEYGKKPVPYKNRAKSVNIFYVYNLLDNLQKMAYNLIKEMIICNEKLKVDLLRDVTRIILV